MSTRRRLLAAAGLVALSFAVSVWALPRAPDRVVTHWKAAGQPDDTMAKVPGLFAVPAVSALAVGLLAVVPRIDPLRGNLAAFRRQYDWFVVVLAGFLAFVHALVVAYNLGYPVDPGRLVLPATGLLLVYVGVLLDDAERNWFVGIRTPWTLSSDEVWRRTHDLGATLFKASGVVALGGVLVPEYAFWLLVGPLVATAVVTTVYSFVVYRRLRSETAKQNCEPSFK